MQKNKFLNFVSFAVTGSLQPLLSFLLLPLFTRYLSPESYGIIAFIDSIILFIAVFSIIGLHHFFMKQYHVVDKQTLFSTLTRFLIPYNSVILSATIIAGLFFPTWPQRLCFILAGASNFLNVLLVLPLRETRLKEAGLRYGLVYSGLAIGQNVLALILVIKGYDIVGRYLGYFIIMLPFGVYYGFRSLRMLRRPWDNTMLHEALRLGIAMSLGALAMMVINVSSRIILKAYVPFDQIGIYSVGYTLGFFISIVCNALYTTFEPTLYKTTMGDVFTNEFAMRLSISVLVVLVPSILVVVLGRYVIDLVLDARYRDCFAVTRFTAVTVLYYLCSMFYTQLGVRLDKKKYLMTTNIIGAAINIGLNLIFIPRFGVLGAVYASFGAYLVIVAALGYLTKNSPIARNLAIKVTIIPSFLFLFVLNVGNWNATANLGFIAVGCLGALWILQSLLQARTAILKNGRGALHIA